MAAIFYSYSYRPSFNFDPLYSPIVPLFFGSPFVVRRYRPVYHPTVIRFRTFRPVVHESSESLETPEMQWEQIPINRIENESNVKTDKEAEQELTETTDCDATKEEETKEHDEMETSDESTQDVSKDTKTIESESQEESSEVETKDDESESVESTKQPESDGSSSSSEDAAKSEVPVEIKSKPSTSLARKNIVPVWETKEDDHEVVISGVSTDGKISNVSAIFNPHNCSVEVSGRVGSTESAETELPHGKMYQYSSYSTTFNRSFELPAECASLSSGIRAVVSDSSITVHCPKHSEQASTSKPLRVIPVV